MELPSKFKMGVSGCLNSCAESAIKDVGLIGTAKGWRLLVGGCASSRPRIGQVLAENLSDEEALSLVDKVITYYKNQGKKQRLGAMIDEIGFDAFKEAVLA